MQLENRIYTFGEVIRDRVFDGYSVFEVKRKEGLNGGVSSPF